jgi:hypothetical protein
VFAILAMSGHASPLPQAQSYSSFSSGLSDSPAQLTLSKVPLAISHAPTFVSHTPIELHHAPEIEQYVSKHAVLGRVN